MRNWKRAINDIAWEKERDNIANEEEIGSMLVEAAKEGKSLNEYKKYVDSDQDFMLIYKKLRKVSRLALKGTKNKGDNLK